MFAHLRSKSETSALQTVLQMWCACKLRVKYWVNFSFATVIIPGTLYTLLPGTRMFWTQGMRLKRCMSWQKSRSGRVMLPSTPTHSTTKSSFGQSITALAISPTNSWNKNNVYNTMDLSFQRLALTYTLQKLSFLMFLMPVFLSYLTVTSVAF